jgi:hypothetical protein
VRRIVLVLLLVAAFVVAGYMLLRPKRAATSKKSAKATVEGVADEGKAAAKSAAKSVTTAARTAKGGKAAGKLKASTRDERRAKTKEIKAAERARKKQLRRQEREKKRMLRVARSRRGKRKSRKGGEYYTLKAIVALGNQSYALIDGRKVTVGDFVLGRKIIEIAPDRIEIEAFGKRSTVRVGESLLPSSYSPTKRR